MIDPFSFEIKCLLYSRVDLASHRVKYARSVAFTCSQRYSHLCGYCD